jgi:hypothetical protein
MRRQSTNEPANLAPVTQRQDLQTVSALCQMWGMGPDAEAGPASRDRAHNMVTDKAQRALQQHRYFASMREPGERVGYWILMHNGPAGYDSAPLSVLVLRNAASGGAKGAKSQGQAQTKQPQMFHLPARLDVSAYENGTAFLCTLSADGKQLQLDDMWRFCGDDLWDKHAFHDRYSLMCNTFAHALIQDPMFQPIHITVRTYMALAAVGKEVDGRRHVELVPDAPRLKRMLCLSASLGSHATPIVVPPVSKAATVVPKTQTQERMTFAKKGEAPDVYYLEDGMGIAAVQSIQTSLELRKRADRRIKVACKWHAPFEKWEIVRAI